MMESVRAESRDRARSTQIGIACELRWKPGGAVPELTMDGGPRIRAGLGDPGFSDLHPPAFCNPLAPPGERYTAFTGALLGLLNKGIPDGPELLTFAQIYPRLQYTLTSRQLPRPRQQGSDTIAHLALTRNLAYTGQGGTRVFSERFTAIKTQLSNAQPAVRLAGVHAMAGLTDDWEENRQTCVDVLCTYLRLPYDPDPGEEADPAERTAYRANREVRHTVIEVINAHLQADASVSWRGLNFDFTDVVFDGGNFRGAQFSDGRVDFADAVFGGGAVDFGGARFSGGEVGFGVSIRKSGDGVSRLHGCV